MGEGMEILVVLSGSVRDWRFWVRAATGGGNGDFGFAQRFGEGMEILGVRSDWVREWGFWLGSAVG